jgi:hypothetical protein
LTGPNVPPIAHAPKLTVEIFQSVRPSVRNSISRAKLARPPSAAYLPMFARSYRTEAMNRASLAFVLGIACVVSVARTGRAAEPAGSGTGADPFAEPDGKEPPPKDDDEAALLGAPARPNPPPPAPPSAAPQSPPNPPRQTTAGGRRRKAQANDEERSGAGGAAPDQTDVAIELSTSGFVSGSLQSGLFVGARLASGLILGGFIDYGLNSVSASGVDAATSTQLVRVGGGFRHTFIESADRMVDLYGAGDASFEYRSSEYPTYATPPSLTLSASGFSLAAGPGLRLWVHDQIAIGYLARFRVTHLSGAEGLLVTPQTMNNGDASSTLIGFDGAFQLLGVF